MYFTKSFITSLLLLFLEAVLFTNILFAFDLVGQTGLPVIGGLQSTYEDKFFGFTAIIDGFQSYWYDSAFNTFFQNGLNGLLTAIRTVDFTNLLKFAPDTTMYAVGDFLNVILTIINIFANIPFVILVIVYFLFFLIYVINLALQFLLFFIFLLQGQVYSYLPNTYELSDALLTIQNSFAF